MFGKKSKRPETPVTAATAVPRPAAPNTTASPTASTGTRASAPGGGKVAKKGEGKLAYETKRAEKAGMGLEKWMAEKDRRARAEREAIADTRRKSDAGRQNQAAKPGLLRRLLDRAHRPI